MIRQSRQVQHPAPFLGDLGATSRPVKGKRPSRGFDFGQQGAQAGGNGNGVGLLLPALGRGKGDCAGLQVHQPHLKARLSQAASGVVADLKAGAHPFLVWVGIEHAAHAQDFLVGEDGSLADRIPAGAPVHHGRGGQAAVQPAHALNPFQGLEVVQGEVAADWFSVGAADGQAPADVGVGLGRGEVVERQAHFVHESGEVAPAVAVMPPRAFRDRMAADDVRDPAVVAVRPGVFLNRKVQGFLHGLGAVQCVVRPVARRFGRPFAVSGFAPDPKPRAVFSAINARHNDCVTFVANHPKTQENKG